MTTTRKIRKVIKSKPTIEGAGVHLNRVFGFSEVPLFDPFLLLDDFRSDDPEHYLKGFPWHPHRGIETITYVLKGDVEHGDSMGNKGVISSGDTQWMTAGSGIIHQEMPKGDHDGVMEGFQLWANLPKSHKMMDPRYRDVKSEQVPEVALANGVEDQDHLRHGGRQTGAGAGHRHRPGVSRRDDPAAIGIHPYDQAGPHGLCLRHRGTGHLLQGEEPLFLRGRGRQLFRHAAGALSSRNGMLVLFDDGDQVTVSTENEPVRFLLISGKPIREPVAWYGPIVMNTEEELRIAFEEYRNGTFIKHKKQE